MYICVITFRSLGVNRAFLPIMLEVSSREKRKYSGFHLRLRIWSHETGSAVPYLSMYSLFYMGVGTGYTLLQGHAVLYDVAPCFKTVVNYVGGLLASRRVFCWLPFAFFCSWSTNSDESTPLNTRIKKNSRGFLHCTSNL